MAETKKRETRALVMLPGYTEPLELIEVVGDKKAKDLIAAAKAED